MEVDSNSNQSPPINATSTFLSVKFANDVANGLKISISRCNADTDTTIATNISTNLNDVRAQTYSRKHLIYQWLKRHLWCVRSSSPSSASPSTPQYSYRRPNESSPSQDERVLIAKQPDKKYFDDVAATTPNTPSFERRTSRSSVQSVNSENGVATIPSPVSGVDGNDYETASTRSDPHVKGLTGRSSTAVAGGARPQDERQVTFSDTVRTHIKTKYVTADEYRQIRGIYPVPKQPQQLLRPTVTAPPPPPLTLSPNSKRIMYRYRVIKLRNRDANNDFLERFQTYDKAPRVRLFRRIDTRCARFRKKDEK